MFAQHDCPKADAIIGREKDRAGEKERSRRRKRESKRKREKEKEKKIERKREREKDRKKKREREREREDRVIKAILKIFWKAFAVEPISCEARINDFLNQAADHCVKCCNFQQVWKF